MKRTSVVRALGLGLGLTLLAPATAMADSLEAAGNGALPDSVAINSMWVIVAAMVVFFMQAGFAFPVMGLSDATIESKFFFQFAFCAVSLAIVWGTTLERIKFGVYIIYSIVFASLIYP